MKLKDELKSAETIYFVCSGNIIRSAFAELYARHLGIDNVASFGTKYHNNKIHSSTKKALIEKGVDKKLVENFHPNYIDKVVPSLENTIFFVMTKSHIQDLLGYNIPKENIYYLTELIGQKLDIEDPYFSGKFKKVFETIEKAILELKNSDHPN